MADQPKPGQPGQAPQPKGKRNGVDFCECLLICMCPPMAVYFRHRRTHYHFWVNYILWWISFSILSIFHACWYLCCIGDDEEDDMEPRIKREQIQKAQQQANMAAGVKK
ncbi:hypothetical protein L596_016196 [Steinernema carpocapsae]|uniref:Uncharacterized protein n=1 Tax=Steinernema carpocapsae TaxID=34508 RepID=A0A4U5NI20_STECR|nr:hypothetical protein L596_016196 [Steinernema carpocapsae]